MVPAHVGIDEPERWTCRCARCEELFGAPIRELTPEVQAFREASVVDFLREVLAHVAARAGRNTVCLLPSTEGAHGISDWDMVASLPGLTTFATDPYWKHWNESAGPFVRRFARLLRERCERHNVGAQLWLPSFGLTGEEIPELEAAVAGAREEGIDDLWTWGYEACGHMSALATPDSPAVWESVTRALTARLPLESRPARELVAQMHALDSDVCSAVAASGDELAAAIDAVCGRLQQGGRLVYVGAGTSVRLAELDAVECPATFGTSPETVIAIGSGHCAEAEDDAERGDADVRAANVGPSDAVVGISASGSTPYTVAGLEAARAAGACFIAVGCAPNTQLARIAHQTVVADVGPELVSGSTRLKAGTAQKLILNALSTLTMIRLGRTYEGLMVSVVPENAKLRERARRNVVLASGAPEVVVDEALAAAEGDARVALVTLLAGIDAASARERLDRAQGSVRQALS